ncbi:hypothetical protein RYZ26_09695 [Terasakiella sp. A23]|uniref:hypothetical protein n=1 Tax=Terasakiella sp. FCG-A23 TaxID=3080561 RepID=UPI0029553B09|nr:hypothetical protein [Terasakiella sp. A23]MDV7339866.1 hypothetical protein [Terasakiella sp. A23]
MLLPKSQILKAFVAILLVTGLTACGYQPLHGKRQTAQKTQMQSELSRVWVQEIRDREGQQLHNELLTLFNTKGRLKKPKYQLVVHYNESSSGLGIGKDDFATRANLVVETAFVLNGNVPLEGTSQSVISYNILTSPTGTEFAKRDARVRAIKNVATDIHRRVAVHLLSEESKK